MASLQSKGETLDQKEIDSKKTTSKALRTTGQAIFFVLTLVWVIFLANTVRKIRNKRNVTPRAKSVITLFSLVGLMLTVRGIFGVLQACVTSVSARGTTCILICSCRTPSPRTTRPTDSLIVLWPSSTVLLCCPSLSREYQLLETRPLYCTISSVKRLMLTSAPHHSTPAIGQPVVSPS